MILLLLGLKKMSDWWVSRKAKPNGVGPVCKFCDRLIDSHPGDHALDCPAVDGIGQIKEWPWNCPRCGSPSTASMVNHICNQCWDYYVFCPDCSEDIYGDEDITL